MPTNFGKVVSGMVAARKRPKKIDPGFSRGILPSKGLHELTKPHPERDAGGETHPKVLLPGKKYGSSGKVVTDQRPGRVGNRMEDLSKRTGAYQDYKKKPKKEFVMKYLARKA